MLGLPAAFQSGGVLVGSFFVVAFAVCSSLCCAFIAHACRIYRAEGLRSSVAPGAREHTLTHTAHLEFETLVRALAHPALWLAFQAVFYCSMCLMAISCIVVTAASLDTLSLLLLRNAWGLQLSPRVAWVASCNAAQAAAAGGCAGRAVFADTAAAGGSILSAGYMLTVAVTAPFALIEISETFQAVSYFTSLACMLQLITKFAAIAWWPGLAGAAAGAAAAAPMPALQAVGWDLGLVMEVAFWSWCVSFAVPMWLDEKAEALPIRQPLWLAFSHRAALDLALGLTGAAAFPRMGPQRLNVLDAVAVHPACGALTKACGVLFVIASLATNIVDYGMVASRNLEVHVGTVPANVMGIALPFAVAWKFYFGTAFADLINAASPCLNGFVQFVAPALLFAAYERYDGGGAGGVGPARTVRLLGVEARVGTWRAAAVGIAAAAAALIAATYALNAAVASGAIHPGAGSAGDYTG
jgi:hypothetical protein